MKKGDLKKQEIIRTAEFLFCRYGYEATSVQDILDELKTSKGSFYHHFISKESLLEEICRIRAGVNAENADHISSSDIHPAVKLNRLFSEMIPFSGEKMSFLLMILPVFLLPEGTSLRAFYRKELSRIYLGPVASVLREGTKSGVFSCVNVECFADISLQLVNSLWLQICDMIIVNEEKHSTPDITDIMNLISQYRIALERLLSAPYGSLDLISIPILHSVIDQIHQHWK